MTDRPRIGWWWPADLGVPERLESVGGMEVPALDMTVERLVKHLERPHSSLGQRSARDIADVLGEVGERFLTDLARPAAQAVEAETGFSPQMADRVVRGMAGTWTKAALTRLLEAEFSDPRVLDEFVPSGGRRIRAYGRGPTLHIGSGSVPGVSTTSMIRALLVKCPSVVKPGLGDVSLATAFARALAESDEALAGALVVQYWDGSSAVSASALGDLVSAARQVVVYGSDDTVADIRHSAPVGTTVVAHPHRMGVVIAGRGSDPEPLAEAACMFEQRGCVSPHLVLFQGTFEQADPWCETLAEALHRVESALPRGTSEAERLGALQQLRGALEIRQAAGEPVHVRFRQDAGWTTILAPLELVEPVGERTVWVVPCPDSTATREALRRLGPVLQSMGVAAPVAVDAVADLAGSAGASRIVPLGDLTFPPAEWLHDGRRPLGELVRWAEAVG